MERTAGGRHVMLATGGSVHPPSKRNSATRWIFSTTLSEAELKAVQANRGDRPSDRARLIIACRQDRGKGTDVVIDSLPHVLARFPKATLDVVGDGADLTNLQQQAAALGLNGKVTFHGAVDHASVLRLLQQADIFCYPTSGEGFPKVVLEALACGLPVVTTRVSVIPELVDGCGIVLDHVTPASVAEAVCCCLSEPQQYRIMSSRAVERARPYSLESWRDTIGGLLRSAWGPLQTDV